MLGQSEFAVHVHVCVPLLAACSSPEREPVSGRELALTAERNVELALRGAHLVLGRRLEPDAMPARRAESGAAGRRAEPDVTPGHRSVEMQAAAPGQSIVPLLQRQPDTAWRKAALVEHHGLDFAPHDPDRQSQNSGNPPS